MSYHQLPIHKHSVSSPYKLQEEALEYIDAVATNNKIMAVQELSDLYGCLENEITKYGMTVEDLKIMSDLTKEVFSKGTRQEEHLLDYLKNNHDSIKSFGLGFIQVKCGDINYNFYHKSLHLFENLDSPHNHQQDFVSEILKGSIEEIVYSVVPGSIEAYCNCGDTSQQLHLDYEYKSNSTHTKGDLYFRNKETYHSVKGSHGSITKVTKYGKKTNAFVISNNRPSDPIYKLPDKDLWNLIEEVYDYNV